MSTASLDMPGDAGSTFWLRVLGWASVYVTLVYVLNNYLSFWQDWPGVFAAFSAIGLLSAQMAKPAEGMGLLLAAFQTLLYVAAVAAAYVYVVRTPARLVRADAEAMAGLTNYIVRAAFWAVLLIGVADAIISFLRVENMLPGLVGEEMAKQLGRSRFRGPYIHFPLLVVALFVATRVKSLGFQWLALLVVVAELFIVLSRFVFSYEQAFQGDLVRFWYGALFLFASAYTLFEDGHVRVDVLYAGFSDRAKSMVNIWGSILLGITLCWTILIFGMWNKSSIVNSALLAYEVSQSGFGMYVKYWMAGFLAVFAITMNFQFTSYALESLANLRNEPGRREIATVGGH